MTYKQTNRQLVELIYRAKKIEIDEWKNGQTDGQTHTQTSGQTDRQMGLLTDTHRQMTDLWTGRQIHRCFDNSTFLWTDRQMGRPTEGQINR